MLSSARPKGTHDVLPPESARWTALVARVRGAGRALRLRPGRSRRCSSTSRCSSGSASAPTSSRKEMYDFDRQGRPPPRAAARGHRVGRARAFVQHRPTPPWKVWYVAPNFRYERPQKGRYRQHWQLGVEALGVDDPDLDVEVIALLAGFYARPRAARRRGCCSTRWATRPDRPAYVGVLRDVPPRARRRARATTFRERVEANPLRVLDSKGADWQDVIERAPQLTEHLSRRVAARTSRRCSAGSTRSASPYELDAPARARLDYYTRTTFEFLSDALDAAQNALGGGGRYDGLAEEMGGPPTPGIGFGIGIERIAARVRRRGRRPGADRAGSTCSSSTGSAATAAPRRCWSRSCASDGFARRPGLRRPVGEGAVEGGRPLRRRGRGDGRRATSSTRDAVAVKDLAIGRAGGGAARRDWSRGWSHENERREQTERAPMMRTASAPATSAPTDVGARRRRCAGGSRPPRPRRRRLPRPARRRRARAVVVDPDRRSATTSTACAASTCCSVDGRGAAPARGHGQRRPADR